MDTQLLINILFGVLGTVAGWLFKVMYNQLRDIEVEVNDLEDKHDADHRLLTKDINALALSLPEKYVNKEDFSNLVKVVHHRFDRIEEKLDELKSNGK
tara:strand:- start:2202 stop:2495 length:294 start_codon:yes stop_codon:yes gene_type:complete